MLKGYLVILLLFVTLSSLVGPVDSSRREKKEQNDGHYHNRFSVKLIETANPDAVAADHGFSNWGPIKDVPGWYTFGNTKAKNRNGSRGLFLDSNVLEYKGNSPHQRKKRTYSYNDPLGPSSWHLGFNSSLVYHADVAGAWNQGYSGKNIHVQLNDDGLETAHPEFTGRYVSNSSYNFVSSSSDPNPITSSDDHGTACAGLIGAARNNSLCSVGVSYDCNISMNLFVGYAVTDMQVASALVSRTTTVGVSSNSWGNIGEEPIYYEVDNMIYDSLKSRTYDLLQGTTPSINTYNRAYLGIPYYFAAGNSDIEQVGCHFDEILSLPWVTAVAAVGPDGIKSEYSSTCSSVFIASPSRRLGGLAAGMRTADLTSNGYCRQDFSGTSAATPVMAGCASLVEEAYNNINYRQISQLITKYSINNSPSSASDSSWVRNSAGYKHSNKYGFGLLNCSALVRAATLMNPNRVNNSNSPIIPDNVQICPPAFVTTSVTTVGKSITFNSTVSQTVKLTNAGAAEHVTLLLNVTHPYAAELKIELVSPSGTVSTLSDGKPVPPFLDCTGLPLVPALKLTKQSIVNVSSQVWSGLSSNSSGALVVFISIRYQSIGTCLDFYDMAYADTKATIDANTTYIFTMEYFDFSVKYYSLSCTLQGMISRFAALGGKVLFILPSSQNDGYLSPLLVENSTYTSPIPVYSVNSYSNPILTVLQQVPTVNTYCKLRYQTPNLIPASSTNVYSMPAFFRLNSVAFWGEPLQGNWTVRITDTFELNDGVFNSFNFELVHTNLTIPSTVNFPANTTLTCTSSASVLQSSPLLVGGGSGFFNLKNSSICHPNILSYVDVYDSSLGCAGSILRTWSYSNNASYVTSVVSKTNVQRIAITDNIAPTLSVPSSSSKAVEAVFSSNASAYTTVANTSQTGQVNASDYSCLGYSASTVSNVTYRDYDVLQAKSLTTLCNGSYYITRQWTATDSCGNTASSNQTIYLICSTGPTGVTVPSNMSIPCGSTYGVDSTGNASTPTHSCFPVSSLSITYHDIQRPGNNTLVIERVWIVTDVCSRTYNKSQYITVLDSQAPTLTVPSNVSMQCNRTIMSNATLFLQHTGIANATDNCYPTPIVDYTDEISNGLCANNYTITRIWSANDLANFAYMNQTIHIYDTIAPTLVVPPNFTASCGNITSLLPNITGAATASDNCDVAPSLTYNDAILPGTCSNSVTILRTWTSQDSCNNTAVGQQYIILLDPSNLFFNSTPLPSSVEDDCRIMTIPQQLQILHPSAPSVCYGKIINYTDSITTTTSASCPLSYQRTVNYNNFCGSHKSTLLSNTVLYTDPVIQVPNSTSVILNVSSCNATMLSSLSPFVNVTGTATASNPCFNGSSTNVTVTHSDTFDIIDESNYASYGYCVGQVVVNRKWTATSFCNNNTSSSSVQLIVLEDKQAPTLTIPNNITISTCFEDALPSNFGGQANATDVQPGSTCGGSPDHLVRVSYTDTIVKVNTTTIIVYRKWVATDNCSNSVSKVQQLTVTDSNPPTLTIPGDVSLTCDVSTQPSPASIVGTANATDGTCLAPTPSYVDVVTYYKCSGTYNLTRVWKATDGVYNVTKNQTISVTDDQAPTLVSPSDTTITCDKPLDPYYSVSYTGLASTNDNCDSSSLLGSNTSTVLTYVDEIDYSNSQSLCVTNYTIRRTWKSTDGCNNTATSYQIIHVQDNSGNQLLSTINTTTVSFMCDTSFFNFSSPLATNGGVSCSPIVYDYSDHLPNGICSTSITRTWMVRDRCNTTTHSYNQTIMIQFKAPTIQLPSSANVTALWDCNAGLNSSSVMPQTTGFATIMDDCGSYYQIKNVSSTIHYNDTLVDDDGNVTTCSGKMVIRRWTAVSPCGLTSFVDQYIKLTDAEAPVISNFNSTVVECTSSSDITSLTSINSTVIPSVNDGCSPTYAQQSLSHVDTVVFNAEVTSTIPSDILTVIQSLLVAPSNVIQVISRNWTASDKCGNQAIPAIQYIIVVDHTPPTLNIPNHTTIECGSDLSTSSTGYATAYDSNCLNPYDNTTVNITYQDDYQYGRCDGEMVIQRHWLAYDRWGNLEDQIQTITVHDTTGMMS
eukprot:TRINITY_DN3773_c0_g1_i4.p1 TRINITY_DN3773_c0_g1~~TRINITY_DN3773_c0_g1_i4.p1  ORF type:complete len:2082 (-),score=456.87 TRINITY_DN3773_c0_g1_i4:94-6339(-)